MIFVDSAGSLVRLPSIRKSLSKLRDKTGYKIAILKAKTSEKSEL